jgi:hypothetical protein
VELGIKVDVVPELGVVYNLLHVEFAEGCLGDGRL